VFGPKILQAKALVRFSRYILSYPYPFGPTFISFCIRTSKFTTTRTNSSRLSGLMFAPKGLRSFAILDPMGQRFERKLPHWRQPGVTYFVTFRLSDPLPTQKLLVRRGICWKRL